MPDQFNPNPLLLPGKSPADPAQTGGFLANQASRYLGLPEMVKALHGQMTPEEGQNFFMQQLPNLLGPEAKFGSLAALHLMPRALLPKPATPVTTLMRGGIPVRGTMDPALADLLHGHGEESIKSFDIVNDLGKNVARTWILALNPKKPYINYIAALDPESGLPAALYNPKAPNALGTKEMLSLIPELKKHFPEAQEVQGFRMTGARVKGQTGPDVGDTARVPLPKR